MSPTKPNPSAAPNESDHPADTLDERKSQILKAIVEEYVATAQPVGSQTVVAKRSLGVSAATVRNEMSVLEREGFITQPHTSAGRVPTDRGYRFFVDHFAPISSLPSPQRREVADFFNSATGVMDQLLHDTSQLLARITRHAAVVVGPAADAAVVRAVHLVALDSENVLVVAVLGNGAIEREIVRFPEGIDGDAIEQAEGALARWLIGRELNDVSLAEDEEFDVVTRAALEALGRYSATAEPLFVGGASRLAAESEAFTSPASVSRLLGLLEQHVVVVGMMRELLGPGLTVTIGSEHTRSDLQECSLVLAPYLVDGAHAGTVGVLGPTRMDYRQAQAAVRTISQQLSRELSR